MSIIDGYLRLVARWRWSLLLGLLIASFLLQPLLSGPVFGELASATMFILIFGGAVYAGRTGPWAARGAVAMLLLALALQVLSFVGVRGLEGPLAAVTLVIVVGALASTFAELVGNRESTIDSLIGAIFGYFVTAAAWALLFRQIEGAVPGSFRLPEGGDRDTQLLYFSLVTVTTVGYGDITPTKGFAQILAALEASVGTLYIAILIGRIVGQLRQDREDAAATADRRDVAPGAGSPAKSDPGS